MQRILAAISLGIVGLTVVALTLLKSQFVIGDLWDPLAHQQRSLDLQLFNGFDNPPIWYGPWINAVGNVLLFLPVGALLHALLRPGNNHPILWSGLIGAAASLCIEVAQFGFAVGYSDIDDLFLNTIGAGLGAWWASRVSRRSRRAFVITAVASCVAILIAAVVG